MFEQCMLDILGLSEIKLREEEKMRFGEVRGVTSGQRKRGNIKEGSKNLNKCV